MADSQRFAVKPDEIRIAASAQAEFGRFRAGFTSRGLALDHVISLHQKHVRRMLNEHLISAHLSGILLTDIEDFDLTLVDINFPLLEQREVGLFSRKSAALIVQLLNK